MPGNAAAEGGFGLGANEAFGGQAGTGSLGGSEVGGAQGSFGGGDFGGGGRSSPAAQAAAASQSVAVAEAVFSNAGVQNGILGMMGLAPNANPNAPAQSMAPSLSAPAVAPGFNPEAVFGMSAPSINPSTGGLLAGSPAPDMAPSVDSSAYSAPDLPSPEVVSPAAPAAMVAPTISMAPTMSLADQSFNPEAVFGMVAPSQNPTTGGLLAGNPTPDMAPVADTMSYGTNTTGLSPAEVAAIGTQVDVDAAMNRGGLQSGNFGPGLLGGTVSSANLAAGNTESVSTGRGGSITSTPGSLESMSFGVPAGLLSASTSTPSQMSVNMADDMAALAAAQAMAPAVAPAPAPAMAPTVAPAPAPAMTPSMTTRPQARPEDDRSFLGRTVNDIQMALSINPFASRQDQAQSLIDRGWNPTDVSSFIARSINTDRSNQAMVENQVGTRDYIPEIAPAPLVTAPESQFERFYVPRLSARGY